MPFTLSHPIAIAPLWIVSKHRLDLAALCIGAMVPDLDLYIPSIPEGGHTIAGLFTIDLPWAVLILIIVRWILTKPFIALLPPYLGSCIPQPPMPKILVACASITIGSLSHIIWDDFTHEHGWFVVRYSLLQTQIGSLPIYKWLQHGCGVLGLIAVALWIAWALGQAKPIQQPETLPLPHRWLILASIIVGAFISAALEVKTSVGPTRESTVIIGVVGWLTGVGTFFLIYASGFWLLRATVKDVFR